MRKRRVHRMRMKRVERCMRCAGAGAAVCLALAAALFAGTMIYDAPGLRIRHIYVRGCPAAIAEDVLASAESCRNENILAADLRSLRDRIEENAWIKQAVLRRRYPDTLEISVSVRTARALVALDEPFLVDAGGVFFARASADHTDLPVICGLTRDDFERDPGAAEQMIAGCLQIIDGMQACGLPLDDDVRIQCGRERGYTLQVKPHGPDIHLGCGDYAYKLSALPRMLADLRSRGLQASSIYLYSHERAFVKLAGSRGHAGGAAGANLPS